MVDFLLGVGAAGALERLIDEREGQQPLVAPDVLVFEVLSALRRAVRRGEVEPDEGLRALVELAPLDRALPGVAPVR